MVHVFITKLKLANNVMFNDIFFFNVFYIIVGGLPLMLVLRFWPFILLEGLDFGQGE